jgi:hypothetical protein
MSQLIFVDSAQHYPMGFTTSKWTYVQGSPFAVGGRTGAGLGNPGNFQFKTFATGYSTLCMGIALNFAGFPSGSYGGPIIAFQNGQYNYTSVGLIGDGTGNINLVIHDPTGGGTFHYYPLGGTYTADAWYYFELYVSIAGNALANTVTYTFEVHVNGSTVLANTTATWPFNPGDGWLSDSTFHNIYVGNPGAIDDVYVTDGEFLGNCRIVPLYPRADGTTNQWTPNGASPNFACVDAPVWAFLPRYVDCPSTGVGDLDEYYLGGTFYQGAIKGVQFLWELGKDESGVGTITSTLKNGASTVNATFSAGVSDGVTTEAPSAFSFQYAIAPYRKSPFTGNDWTMAEILATQQGMTRNS